MTKPPPPVPPAGQAPHGSNKDKPATKNAARHSEHGAKPDETGDNANIKQNTPHPGSRHDR